MKAKIGKWTRIFTQTNVPLVVYGAVALAMGALWLLRHVHEDLAFNLISELIGVAFTIFVIDTLLVRSKTRRWRLVQENVDYLIARTINRLRDGVALRAFQFSPDAPDKEREHSGDLLRTQRAAFLSDLAAMTPETLAGRVFDKELFCEDSYQYFNEKADDLWQILNMKYAEYLEPGLVALLIDLHTRLKDLCGHIRHHRKAERFPGRASGHYRESGRRGAGLELVHILRILEDLKAMGYSKPPEVSRMMERIEG
jgi:hypothetical protein